MTQIIKEYFSINDYINDVKNNPSILMPGFCDVCGRQKFSLNGSYERKSQGRGKETQVGNGTLFIKRFKCSNNKCNTHYSILPSLIPPLRWYLCCMQQYIILLFFSGVSIKQIVAKSRASKSTIKRWLSWSKNKWSVFCNELMTEHPWLSGVSEAKLFYCSIFEKWDLSQVMCKLHDMGQLIPY